MRQSRSSGMRHVLVLVGLVAVAFGTSASERQRPTTAVASAAVEFLASLAPEQRQKAVFPLDSSELTRWHYVPHSQFPRNGVPLKEMTSAQRQRAHALLSASLSQQGYGTATAIMDLEIVLRELEGRVAAPAAALVGRGIPALATSPAVQDQAPPTGRGRGGRGGNPVVRDPDLYFFAVFGDPSSASAWAWRVNGHHLSLHFAVENGTMKMTSAPLFLGANPHVVRDGPKAGLRVLGTQEDAARALLDSLDAAQRTTAILAAAAQGDIVTGTRVKIDPLTPSGLRAADMTAAQRQLLMHVIEAFTSKMQADEAAEELADIRSAGIEHVAFAWAGPTEPGARYYYRVQGPTFLLEHNNTQSNGNHVHSVWREFNGDFGRDLLGDHLAAHKH